MIDHERTGAQPVDEAFTSPAHGQDEHASSRTQAPAADESAAEHLNASGQPHRQPSSAASHAPGINVPAWVSPFEQPQLAPMAADRAADEPVDDAGVAPGTTDEPDEPDVNDADAEDDSAELDAPAGPTVHIHPSVHDLIGGPTRRPAGDPPASESPVPASEPQAEAQPPIPDAASPEAESAEPEEAPLQPAVAPAATKDDASEASAPTVPPPDLTRRRSLRVIALMNQKGGVGKTTSTANLGAALAAQGERVLLVDLDPQAHLTLHVGVEPDELEESIYDLLVDDDKQAWEVAVEVNPNLYILPAEVNLAGAESELAPRMIDGRAQRCLRDKVLPLVEGRIPRIVRPTDGPADPLDPQDRPFDYVLIDCPPSLGLLTINALIFAREVFVPMQAHFLALQGLSKLLDTCRHVQTGFNPALKVSGVILCMHEGQTILASEVVQDLTGFLEQSRGEDVPWRDAEVFQPAIRRNIKLAECPSYGQTIFDYAPTCAGAADYAGLARAVIRQTVSLG